MSLDEFQYLNPQHNRPVIAGADEHTILLPIDKAELFAAKLELTDQPLVSWQAYRVQPGETLPQVAAKFGHVGRDAARGQRHRRAGAACRDGHTLLVPSQRPSARVRGDAAATRCSRRCRRAARSTTACSAATRCRRSRRATAVTAQDIRGWNGARRRTASRAGPAAAHHQRPRAERQQGQARDGQDASWRRGPRLRRPSGVEDGRPTAKTAPRAPGGSATASR